VGGMTRAKHIPLLAAGGTNNHLHALVALPSTMTVAEAIQFLKGNTSHWMNENSSRFAWQEGYGAFSVSQSQRARVIRYIDGQAEHHKKWTFEDEFISLLAHYGIAYDPKYVFG
jgi:REP element-mobilizing transposase RayT